LIKEAIETIKALVQAEVRMVEIDGKQYATKELVPAPFPRPDPLTKSIELTTLTGFIAFVKTKLGTENYAKQLIHVSDHRTVELFSDPIGFHKQRERLIFSQADDLFTGNFKFNTFVSHSTFMIAIQTLFQEGQYDWEKVTRIISTIKEERVTQSQDDGMAQNVTAKAGIAVVSDVEVPRIVTLKPYRTFREVEQPASQFVLRLQAKQGELPQIALFEADGGKWKTDAIEAISEYLKEELGADAPALIA